jgi:hypothetical protein
MWQVEGEKARADKAEAQVGGLVDQRSEGIIRI